MAEGIDEKGDGKKKQPLTLEEIQAKYYSEGPEAARTTKYIEVTGRPSTSRVQPQDVLSPRDKDVEAGSYRRRKGRFEGFFTRSFSNAAESSDEEYTLNYSTISDLEHGLHRQPTSERDYADWTPEERKVVQSIRRKQRTYAKIVMSFFNEDSEAPGKKRPIYYDTDDEDDEDFYYRAEDYPEDDWHHHMLTFYRKYKPLILFVITMFQVLVFLGMFALVITVYAPLDRMQELERLKAEGYIEP